jgi:uncharacterized membrane protein YeaQ/YmgE (transglycosylase-associated protein family)
MSPVHLHLLLNHLPVIGTIVAIVLLAYALVRRSPELVRASLGMFVLFALAGAVVYLTGEPAEELVEGLPGVSEAIMERHEEAALVATTLLGLVGAVALGGLLAFRKRAAGIPRGFAAAALLLALVPAAAMGYTANLGGQIRHTEIRPSAVPAVETAGRDARTERAARTSERDGRGERDRRDERD